MSELEQGSDRQAVPLVHGLITFYDEFAEFNDQCAFLTAAMACVLADEGCNSERVVRGAECWAFWIRQRMDRLQQTLRQLQRQASANSCVNDDD